MSPDSSVTYVPGPYPGFGSTTRWSRRSAPRLHLRRRPLLNAGVSRKKKMMRARTTTLAAVVAAVVAAACRPAPRGATKGAHVPEQAVLVHLRLSDAGFGTREEMVSIHALSGRLEARIAAARVGEFDGDEFGQGECMLFMYGPNADALFEAVEPELRASPLSRGGWVIKRYGASDDDSAKEVRIDLDSG
jgi:hypothetical protein